MRIFGKGKCKLIANCATFWQASSCTSARDGSDFLALSFPPIFFSFFLVVIFLLFN